MTSQPTPLTNLTHHRQRQLRIQMDTEVTKVLDNMERHRPYRAVFYAFLLGAGAILAYDPTRQLREVAPIVRFGWGGFLVLGGILTLYGTFRDRWLAELQGVLLLGTALTGLVFVLVAGGGTTGRLAFACFLAALVTALASRLWGLWQLGNATSKIDRKRKEVR